MKSDIYKGAITAVEKNEFFERIYRNYPQIEGYIDFAKVASLLGLSLWTLKKEINSNQPISLARECNGFNLCFYSLVTTK